MYLRLEGVTGREFSIHSQRGLNTLTERTRRKTDSNTLTEKTRKKTIRFVVGEIVAKAMEV